MARLLKTRVGRVTGVILAPLAVALAVAVTLLDAGTLAHGLAVESHHHATTCPRPHDHHVCSQVAGRLSLPHATPDLSDVLAGAPIDLADPLLSPRSVLGALLARPRAPPA
ncbi:MAG: hypothetical protein Q8N53_17615 [Longimicrobiales bacterium]|nr:hypothetical protein [Longimicrobiales bacterium]